MVSEWTAALEDSIRKVAKEVGFDLFGVAAASGDPNETSTKLGAERFLGWVEAGHAGEMEYLKRRDDAGVLLRTAVQVAIPWAQSVIVCAMNYNVGGPRSIEPAASDSGWIGRYAWSGRQPSAVEPPSPAGLHTGLEPTDYHDFLLAKLRTIEAALHAQVECETLCYVDTGPLVERSAAAQAGIGWIGKNTCVLNQEMGSWLLLAVIITSLRVGGNVSLRESADRCGSCTRCIDACPTGALVGERQMDASRCIAYLTIEKKASIAEEFREAMGRQVFGCDICQDVCPWNRKSPIATREGSLAREELVNPALEWLAGMDAAEFKRRFKGSPLERTKRKRLQRNVAIAMGNSGETKFLPQLQEWIRGEDEVLAEAADWAAKRIQTHAGPSLANCKSDQG
jgi:epoxyqueuosine reductase